MRLAALLLVLVAATHYGYAPIAALFEDQDQAARALFYVFRGLEGAALYAVIAFLVRHPAVWAVCLWGAIEESQTAVCRLSSGIANEVRVDLFDGLCGPGWYGLGVCIAAGLAASVVQGARQ